MQTKDKYKMSVQKQLTLECHSGKLKINRLKNLQRTSKIGKSRRWLTFHLDWLVRWNQPI